MSESDEMKNDAAFEKWWAEQTKYETKEVRNICRPMILAAWNAAITSLRAEPNHSPNAGEFDDSSINNVKIVRSKNDTFEKMPVEMVCPECNAKGFKLKEKK